MAKPRIIAPPELENYLVIENCDEFPIDRYYATQVQRELINSILETEKLTVEMHKLGLPYLNATLLSGPPGNGKAQPLYSKVLTPNGFVEMGSLSVGDTVISGTGKPSKILGIYPQGEKEVYEITFHDGAKTRCTKEHLWTVQTRDDRKDKKYRTIDLNRMMKNLYVEHKTRKNYSIDYAIPINFREKEYYIHPYVLGALIGDGGMSSNTLILTTADSYIKEKVENLLPSDYELSLKGKNRYDYDIKKKGITRKSANHLKISPLRNELRRLGLWGCHSDEKFIPEEYKIGSVEQRLTLIQGLFDTDGYVANNDHVEYVTASKKLAEDVREIVYSLGGFANISIKNKTTYFYKKKKTSNKSFYRVFISFPAEYDTPFSLPRKVEAYHPKRKKEIFKRYIKDVTYIGKEKCQCIYIDDPSHLYITDDYIITHNTTFARFVAFTIGVDLVYINFATLISGVLGSTSQHIHDIFSFLKDKKCVFLLDEIDTIGVKRGTESSATGGELSRITVTVMQELDYYKTHDYKAIILAATNRKDILDPALVSRFAVAKELPSLTNDERIAYMRMFLDDVGVPYDKENIKLYVLDNATVRQRNLEMDMIRCIAEWIKNGREGNVIINHVD